MLVARLLLAVLIFAVANGLAGVVGGSAAATRVSAEAYTLAAGLPSQPIIGAPYAALPPDGGSTEEFSPGTGVGTGSGVTSLDGLLATTAGARSDVDGWATSSATVGLVELFAGLVRATNVRAVASSGQDGRGARSSATLTFETLTVAGLDYRNPPPNERVELPGVGYIVLNEQLVGGDGRTSSSIIVRAFRLHVTADNLLDTPAGTEFIVANAASGVPEIGAGTVVAGGPRPPGTLSASYAPISTRPPVDIRIGDRDEDDNLDLDNVDVDEGDQRASPARGSPTAERQTVLVTVVVVPATPTPTSTMPTPAR